MKNSVKKTLFAFVSTLLLASLASAQKSKVNPLADPNTPSRYFVVQNIATEKMRVYERCFTTPDCPHRMIMETEMVVGRTSDDKNRAKSQPFLTWVGHYKITRWVKFYEDGESHYPSWYSPNYPEVPMNAGSSDWMGKRYLPNPKVNVYRGAFGWWAAMVSPDANGQWIHGTYGWGRDGKKYIELTRNPLVNLVGDPRSSGCTRLENQAVAWSRHNLPVGTDVFRIYAMEAYADKYLAAYQNQKEGTQWNWILTKQGSQKDTAPSADKEMVLAQMDKGQITQSDILEEGSYKVDQYPDGLGYSGAFFGFGVSSGTTGDTYNIGRKKMKGVYLVDQGRFVNYQHPESLSKGGFNPAKPFPAFTSSTISYVLADPFNYRDDGFGNNGVYSAKAPGAPFVPQQFSAEEYLKLQQTLDSRVEEIKEKLK